MSPDRLSARPCGDVAAVLGEGSRWDGEREELLWVDILGCELHRGRIGSSGVERIGGVRIDRHLGAVAPVIGGGWVVAAGAGFALVREDGSLEELAQPEADAGGRTRMNDGACDPQGRFWAGSMAYDEEPGAGALYRLDGDGSVREMVPDQTVSNGLGWSPNGRTMFYSDSGTARVDAFAFDGATGTLSDRRTIVQYGGGEGGPGAGEAPLGGDQDGGPGACDGLTVDDEGALWIAVWDGWRVERRAPDGSLLAVVELPVARATSCCFAERTLVITTASVGLSDADRARQPDAGRLFWVDAGVSGPPAVPYRRA